MGQKLILFFLTSICFADPVFISLGENCNVAMALSQHNLRKQAFPFDWNITPFHALFDVFNNEFSDFLCAEHLFLSDDSHTVVNQRYGIAFAHDFPTYDTGAQDEDGLVIPIPGVIKPDFLSVLPKTQEKYQRRIKRLYNILNGQLEAQSRPFTAEQAELSVQCGKALATPLRSGESPSFTKEFFNGDEEVIFIRHNHTHISKAEVIHFCELMESKFPTLKFTLIVWGYEDEMKEDWNHPRIKTYQVIRGNSIEAFYKDLLKIEAPCQR